MTGLDMKATTRPRTDAWARPLDSFDMSDPAYYQDDTWYPYFERLRREAPVHFCAESDYGPYWSITRYRDIADCLVNHGVFSSEIGGSNIQDPLNEDHRNRSFINMDPPNHAEKRRVVSPMNAPKNLAEMETLIRRRTQTVLDSLPRNETFDWVPHVSVNLTGMMLATLLDVPEEDRAKLTYWSDAATCNIRAPDAPVRSEDERHAELKKMAAYMWALFEEKRKAPPSFDLLSMLAHGSATCDMPPHEFIGTMVLLIVGGNDTTRNTMSGGLLALNEFPDEYRKLMANPALAESATVEMIRYVSPAIHRRRTTTQETEVAGQVIPAGAKVVLWQISGNRDETVIDRPNRLIVDRKKSRQHLSFGAGIHRCVGDRLAELQLRILWEEILQRFPTIEVMGEPQRSYSATLRGINSLPVRIPA